MGKLSGVIINQIALQMVKSKNEEIESIKTKLNQLLILRAMSYIPKDVIEFIGKYPFLIKTYSHIYWTFDDNIEVCFEASLPKMNDNLVQIVMKNHYNEFNELALKLYRISKDRNTLINKIKCTISKLGTSKNLKNNFPEAYKEYCSFKEIPTDNVDNICDSVENLRAELNSSKL